MYDNIEILERTKHWEKKNILLRALLIAVVVTVLYLKSLIFLGSLSIILIASLASIWVWYKVNNRWTLIDAILITSMDILLSLLLIVYTGGIASPFLPIIYLLPVAIFIKFPLKVSVRLTGIYCIIVSIYLLATSFAVGSGIVIITLFGMFWLMGQHVSSFEILNDEAYKDSLTGVLNRRFFEKHNKQLLKKYDLLTFLMADVNILKTINDKYGHNHGDEALVLVADVLKTATRKRDLVVRWGGDEFMIVLPGVNKQDAVAVAERIHDSLRDRVIFAKKENVKISLSIGITEKQKGEEITETVNRVDMAMYESKRRGNHLKSSYQTQVI